MITFREQLARPGAFVVAAELVTSRGLITADSSRRVMEMARELAADPRIDVLSITDNPGGHAMLSPDTLGTDLISRGQEVIIHLSCKDWNRNALESRGWKLGSEGFDNVLALSGDYPVTGHKGLAAPVFDIDSVGLLSLFSEMNEGFRDERKPEHAARPDELLPRLRRDEPQAARARGDAAVLQAAEEGRGGRALRHQPDRLEHAQGRRAAALDQARRPARLGARQRLSPLAAGGARLPPGEDPRRRRHRRAARARRAPRVRARTRAAPSSSSWPPSTSRSRAGSASTASTSEATCRRPTFGEILDLAGSFADDDWRAFAREIHYPFADEFYFFEADPETKLSSDEVNAAYLESKRRRKTELRVPLKYRFSRRLHAAAFEPDAPLFPAGRAFYRAVEKAPAAREGRARGSSRWPRCRSSAAATAATARCPRSPTSARSRSARRTSATVRAAAPGRACARSTTRSASGRRRTSG